LLEKFGVEFGTGSQGELDRNVRRDGQVGSAVEVDGQALAARDAIEGGDAVRLPVPIKRSGFDP